MASTPFALILRIEYSIVESWVEELLVTNHWLKYSVSQLIFLVWCAGFETLCRMGSWMLIRT